MRFITPCYHLDAVGTSEGSLAKLCLRAFVREVRLDAVERSERG
jgi:hypothetical protein